MTLAKILPIDTRLSELAAAWALLFLAAMIAAGATGLIDGINVSGLINHEPSPFWVIILSALGALQLFAVATSPRAEILRIVMAWACGTAWVWLSLASNIGHTDPPDPAALVLGLSNLYAFCINSLLIRHQWTS